MTNPSTLDSADVPSWIILSTDDLPDALRRRLESTTSAHPTVVSSTLLSISKTSVTVTPATELGNPGAHVGSSATHGAPASTTSVASTDPAPEGHGQTYGQAGPTPGPTGFDSNGGVTVSSSSTSRDDTSTLALRISIPIGVFFVVGLLLSGIIIGRRMARRDASGWNKPSAKRWWTFWRGGGGHVQLNDQEGLDLQMDQCELSGEDTICELPTDVNIQEMEERREPVELPVPSPPGSLRGVRGGENRGM